MDEAEKITFTVIKLDIGSYVGHSSTHPELMEAAQQHLSSAVEKNLLIDGKVVRCGDNLALIVLCPVPPQEAVQAATESRQNSVQCRVRQVCG